MGVHCILKVLLLLFKSVLITLASKHSHCHPDPFPFAGWKLWLPLWLERVQLPAPIRAPPRDHPFHQSTFPPTVMPAPWGQPTFPTGPSPQPRTTQKGHHTPQDFPWPLLQMQAVQLLPLPCPLPCLPFPHGCASGRHSPVNFLHTNLSLPGNLSCNNLLHTRQCSKHLHILFHVILPKALGSTYFCYPWFMYKKWRNRKAK